MAVCRWTERCTWAREEARRRLGRGLNVMPTLLLFEGEQPTVYLRPTVGGGLDRHAGIQHLTGFAARMGARRAVAVYEATLSDPACEDEDVRRATGERAIIVEWVDGDTDPIGHGTSLLHYTLDDDGQVQWGEEEVDDGPGVLGQHLQELVEDGDGPLASMATADACYAVSRQGLVVGVHPDWRSHYGLDRAPDPRGVRPVDRLRATRLRDRLRSTDAPEVRA